MRLLWLGLAFILVFLLVSEAEATTATLTELEQTVEALRTFLTEYAELDYSFNVWLWEVFSSPSTESQLWMLGLLKCIWLLLALAGLTSIRSVGRFISRYF